ncbi:MAG TPA: AAA family ATPase [Gaiellales bacterium]|nr:AAA family ATPase [Gaiellales bacterium]
MALKPRREAADPSQVADMDDAERALRDALVVSPQNVPLRLHLADTLLRNGRPADAETEYREAVALSPTSVAAQLGLAAAFFQQGKLGEATVVVEATLKRGPDAATLALHARLLLAEGRMVEAAAEYLAALDLDPDVRDADLDSRLGHLFPPDDEPDREPVGPAIAGTDDHELEIERPSQTFADVGGMERVKEEIRLKIIHPLEHEELYRAYGKPVGGGILLYGPPGCGKTHLARATAGEISASFLAVGLSDVLDMWIGNSEKRLHAAFEQARRRAPCVLFFDEVDALGANRGSFLSSGGRSVVNQFLAELDGIQSSNDGVLVLAATNTPWHVDPAFRRPGRFDRVLFVPPPDEASRAAILRIHVSGKPVDDIDFGHLARKTEGFSGADLRAVVDLAVEAKIRAALRDGVPRPLGTKDLAAAAKSATTSTHEWFATARNYALHANEGGAYDDIRAYLRLR